jgi:hypothetical protein
MLTLIFNTTKRTVNVIGAYDQNYSWEKVPTVKVFDGYYEVMQKDELDKSLPVARFPISNTIMLIEK